MIPRLSALEYRVLSLLDKAGAPCRANALVIASKRAVRDGNKVTHVHDLKPGSVYVTLDRMIEKGLIEKTVQLAVSVYQATKRGEKLFKIARQFDKG